MTQTPLHNIVYCSQNRIHGDEAEVTRELRSILSRSRVNNSRIGVTGALLYNAGSFAQILEGPLSAIEKAFEKIQRDARHSEVIVIQSEPISCRQFADWSMAFADGSSMEGKPVATAAFKAVFAREDGASEQMLSTLRDLIVSDIDWVLAETV